MKRLIVMAAAVILASACGAEDGADSSTSALSPEPVEITRAVGYVPDMGGASYEFEIGSRASQSVWCSTSIKCDGVELVFNRDTNLTPVGLVYRYYLYDGAPSCSSRTVRIDCPNGSSAESIWSAN